MLSDKNVILTEAASTSRGSRLQPGDANVTINEMLIRLTSQVR
ncbi:MAG: hypothetical protein V3T84_05490 [Phycisphaerales bacterium]